MTARPRQRRRPAAGNSESSVDRIRETALRIFAERGYHATSVRDITAASGVVPAALYNHFQSKADPLQDLILRGHDEIDKRVEAALAAPGLAPAERLARITRELARFHAEQTDLATLSNREFRALPEPQLQAIIASAGGCAAVLRTSSLMAWPREPSACRSSTASPQSPSRPCQYSTRWFILLTGTGQAESTHRTRSPTSTPNGPPLHWHNACRAPAQTGPPRCPHLSCRPSPSLGSASPEAAGTPP